MNTSDMVKRKRIFCVNAGEEESPFKSVHPQAPGVSSYSSLIFASGAADSNRCSRFEKNERSNVDADELKAFQELACEYLALEDEAIEHAVSNGKFTEICYGNEEA